MGVFSGYNSNPPWEQPFRSLLQEGFSEDDKEKHYKNTIIKSGWPSGLRRQTQGGELSQLRDFWSPNGGVGSNPTSDNNFMQNHCEAQSL